MSAGGRPAGPRSSGARKTMVNRKSSSPNNDSKGCPPRRRNASQAAAALPRKIFSGEAGTSFDEPMFAGEISESWPDRSGPNVPTFDVDRVEGRAPEDARRRPFGSIRAEIREGRRL